MLTVKLHDGGSLLLRPLKVEAVIDLVDAEWERERIRLVTDLEAAGADMETRLRELREYNRTHDLGRELVRSCFGPRGLRNVIGAALLAQGNGTTFEALDLAANGWQLALDLLDVRWRDWQQEADPTKTTGPSPDATGG